MQCQIGEPALNLAVIDWSVRIRKKKKKSSASTALLLRTWPNIIAATTLRYRKENSGNIQGKNIAERKKKHRSAFSHQDKKSRYRTKKKKKNLERAKRPCFLPPRART